MLMAVIQTISLFSCVSNEPTTWTNATSFMDSRLVRLVTVLSPPIPATATSQPRFAAASAEMNPNKSPPRRRRRHRLVGPWNGNGETEPRNFPENSTVRVVIRDHVFPRLVDQLIPVHGDQLILDCRRVRESLTHLRQARLKDHRHKGCNRRSRLWSTGSASSSSSSSAAATAMNDSHGRKLRSTRPRHAPIGSAVIGSVVTRNAAMLMESLDRHVDSAEVEEK